MEYLLIILFAIPLLTIKFSSREKNNREIKKITKKSYTQEWQELYNANRK